MNKKQKHFVGLHLRVRPQTGMINGKNGIITKTNNKTKPPLPKGSEASSTVVNDSPVDCQSRGVTEPQRDGGPLAVEGL